MESVKLNTNDGFKLDVDYYSSSGCSGVIYTHGATSHRAREKFFERAADELVKTGVHCLNFDLRGHGKSEGDSAKDFLLSGAIRDLSSAVDYLVSKGVTSIGLVGASLGASVSSIYASRNLERVKALLLINPVLNYHTSFFEPTTHDTRMLFGAVHATLKTQDYFELPWNNFRLGRPAFEELSLKLPEHDPILALHSYNGPILVIHGDKDRTVDYAETVGYFEKIPNPLKQFITIKDADHCFRSEPGQTEMVDKAIEFFKNNLPN